MKYLNNPCNIRKNNTIWLGQIRSDKPFCEFDTLVHGLRAVFKILATYHSRGYVTIPDMMSHYAPPNENNTRSYINFVCNHCHYPRTSSVDLYDKTLMKSIVRYMCLIESSTAVSDSVLDSAYLDAFPKYKLPF